MNEPECVKCGAKRQPGDLECPQCGVIYGYFQFPNNIGGYNEIDWKTGEKRSISDQAIYFFRD